MERFASVVPIPSIGFLANGNDAIHCGKRFADDGAQIEEVSGPPGTLRIRNGLEHLPPKAVDVLSCPPLPHYVSPLLSLVSCIWLLSGSRARSPHPRMAFRVNASYDYGLIADKPVVKAIGELRQEDPSAVPVEDCIRLRIGLKCSDCHVYGVTECCAKAYPLRLIPLECVCDVRFGRRR
jgi:hypothetical protein